jgi:hypothetical protein
MPYICPLCSLDPLNHSLVKIKETNDTIIFYSCPSKAKLYFDCEGIINHYNGILSEMNPNKKWIWIFDSDGFNFKHFMQIEVGIQLAKLITNKFSNNLSNIIIVNPTIYISLVYNIIKPFLSDRVNQVVVFNNDRLTPFDSSLWGI